MVSSLEARLWAKVAQPNERGCRLWTAGRSRGGYREVDYGELRIGKRVRRAHRIVLMLKTAPIEVPRDDDETFEEWFRRVDRWYRDLGYEASHTCDVSLCCTPDHLEWQDHGTNVKQQAERRRRRRQEAAA